MKDTFDLAHLLHTDLSNNKDLHALRFSCLDCRASQACCSRPLFFTCEATRGQRHKTALHLWLRGRCKREVCHHSSAAALWHVLAFLLSDHDACALCARCK